MDRVTDYPMGVTVTFADANATVSDGVAGLMTGMVNGDPIADDEGVVLFVPVWATRDHDREPTTIFVAVPNIVSVG
jgi:hypothetical protein